MPEIVNTSALSFDSDVEGESLHIEDDRPTAIKIENVSMVFNMASERLNNLKEYFLKIVKHELFFEELVALDDISFEVKKGDVFGILGTNGSGKSTLLKIVAGVLEPTRGKVEINGAIAPLIELGAGFDMDLSARENIYLNGALLGYSKEFIQEHFDDIVEFAEVEKFLDMPMKNYSSGMVARIAFAIATVMVPEILIVDEVLSVGDFMFQQKCEDRITELIEKHGVTVLIVSHSNDQIERLCNKAIWIEKGHPRIMGDAKKVCDAYRVLGGRTGSAESENVVFSALKKIENNTPAVPIETINGEDHFQIAVNLAKHGWQNESNFPVILVPETSHSQAVMASCLSGVLNAPLLPYRKNEMPVSLSNGLHELKPSKVFLVANTSLLDEAIHILQQHDCCKEIVSIPCESYCIGIRHGILKFIIENSLSCSDSAILINFHDLFLAFSSTKLSSECKIPVLIFDDDEDSIDGKTLQLMQEIGIHNLYFAGSIKTSKIAENSYPLFATVLLPDNNASLPHFSLASTPLPSNVGSILIAPTIESRWTDLINAGPFANKKSSQYLLENPYGLDSIARCIHLCAEFNPTSLIALNQNYLTKTNMRILASSCEQRHLKKEQWS